MNILVVFLLSGFWHGANWTFVIWGGLHGIYLIAYRLVGSDTRSLSERSIPRKSNLVLHLVQLLLTFHLVLLAWVFFRSESVATAMLIIEKILVDHGPLFRAPTIFPQALFVTGLLLALEWFNWRTEYWVNSKFFCVSYRISYAMALFFAIVLFGMDSGSQFIYFQF